MQEVCLNYEKCDFICVLGQCELSQLPTLGNSGVNLAY